MSIFLGIEKNNETARENVKLAQSTADTAEREKRLLGVELEDVRREQATTLKFETLTKTQCMQVS